MKKSNVLFEWIMMSEYASRLEYKPSSFILEFAEEVFKRILLVRK